MGSSSKTLGFSIGEAPVGLALPSPSDRDEMLEVRQRFGNCEAPLARCELLAEQGQGDLVAAPPLGIERRSRLVEAGGVVCEHRARSAGRIRARFSMTGAGGAAGAPDCSLQ